MKYLLLAGASLLAIATPALAQIDQRLPPDEAASGTIDTLVDDQSAPAAAPATTGDRFLDRLTALETRIKTLEARNAELEQQAELNEGRLESVEARAAKNVQFTWGPTLADTNGNFTFKPRGVIEADYAGFFERSGGYDYNNGTAIRRARIGLEGTALKYFNYRIEVDFAGTCAVECVPLDPVDADTAGHH